MLSKMRKTNNKGFTLIELMIVIAIIGILAAIAIPNFIAYRNKTFCSKAESDANNIAADIADYFAIPTHIDITTDDVNYDPGANTFTVVATNPNTVITVTVTDVSNRCPEDYISASQGSDNPKGDGWAPYNAAGPNIYTKTIRQAAVN